MPSRTPAPDETAATEAIIRDCTGLPDVPPLILLNINCSDLLPLRKWDTANYIELARRLMERYDDVYIGFTGSPEEAEEAERVAAEVHASAVA